MFNAALASLRRWARYGLAVPPSALPIGLNADGTVARDTFGNALGGVRTPQLEVPIATLLGTGGCSPLVGSTMPFGGATLAALYPTHQDYVGTVRTAARRARRQRFLLRPDVRQILGEASQAAVPP